MHWIIKKAREFWKNIYFCIIDYVKLWIMCVNHNKLLKILENLPLEKSVCRSRSNVRTGLGTTDWFQIGKGVHQGCILSPCLFNLYAEYIMRNTALDEVQAGMKIAGRNINHLRYTDDTTFIAKVKNNFSAS